MAIWNAYGISNLANKLVLAAPSNAIEHSDELAGQHVKVIVLQEDKKSQSLAEALKGKIGLLEFDVPEDLHQRTGEALTDILD